MKLNYSLLLKIVMIFGLIFFIQDVKYGGDVFFYGFIIVLLYGLYRDFIFLKIINKGNITKGVLIDYKFDISNDNTSNITLTIELSLSGMEKKNVQIKTVYLKPPQIGDILELYVDEKKMKNIRIVNKSDRLNNLLSILFFLIVIIGFSLAKFWRIGS